jgi:transcriptional regulator with XRE-family HTH domain
MNTVRTGKAPRNPEHERVGETIHRFRERLGYTQLELAVAAGISRPHLANIEAGRKPLSNIHLARIAKALDLKPLAIKCFDVEDEMELAA